MALTPLQRDVCRRLADGRRRHRDSYVAGGVALSVALRSLRLSRDVDLFHDTTEAVARSWDRDRLALDSAGFEVTALRERPGYVEAAVSRGADRLVMEWTRDSAFRFFPLVEDDDLGLAPASLRPRHEQGAGPRRAARGARLGGRAGLRRPPAAAGLSGLGGVRQGPGLYAGRHSRPGPPLVPLLGRRAGVARLRRAAPQGVGPVAGNGAASWTGPGR